MVVEPHWDHFEQGTARGVVGVGATPASAFAEAARGLTALVTDLGEVELREAVEIRLPSAALAPLLQDWLAAVARESAERQMLFGDFDVFIGDGELVAHAHGEPAGTHRHDEARRLAAIRFDTPAVIEEEADQWAARCLVWGAPQPTT